MVGAVVIVTIFSPLLVKILLQFPHLCLALLAVLEFLHKPVHVFEHECYGDVQNVVVRGLWYEYDVVRLWMWMWM